MPIPERLRPPPPTAEELAFFTELCQQIANCPPDNERLPELLARWNARAGTEYPHDDFLFSSAEFPLNELVTAMLMGQPTFVPDLTYAELREVLRTVSGELSEADLSFFLRWFDANLPGANTTDLFFRRDLWFKNDDLFHAHLTHDQILAYAMAKSGRRLPDAPENVTLPYPIPS